jgi:hypothetical protein
MAIPDVDIPGLDYKTADIKQIQPAVVEKQLKVTRQQPIRTAILQHKEGSETSFATSEN